MVDGRQLKKAIDKFMQSPVCLDARVQIELPNGEMYDLTTMTLLENRLLGSSETHRLVLRCAKPKIKMGKIIRLSLKHSIFRKIIETLTTIASHH